MAPSPLTPSRRRRLLPAVGYAVGMAVPVTALALLVRERVDVVLSYDAAAITAVTDLTRSHPGLCTALVTWQEAFQPIWVYSVGTGVCAWLWWRHRLKTRAIWGFVTMMVSWNIALDVKYVVQRARPVVEDAVSHAPGYSFPSGHAANTAAAATAVTVVVWPVLANPAAKMGVVTAAAVVVVLTALDRLFLGVHFPSDVTAGVLLGSGLVLASYAGFRGWNPAHSSERPDTPGPRPTDHSNRSPRRAEPVGASPGPSPTPKEQ